MTQTEHTIFGGGKSLILKTYHVSGIATKKDKVRGIEVGDADSEVYISDSPERVLAKTSLDKAKIISSFEVHEDWDGFYL